MRPVLFHFAFSHRLTRESSYAALLSSNRRTLHSAAAAALRLQIVPGAPACGRKWEERAARSWELARAADPALPEQSLLLLRNRGDRARARGDYASALPLLERALELAQQARRHDQAAHVLLALGRIATEQQRLADAQRLMEESLAAMDRAGTRGRAIGTLISLGAVYFHQGDLAGSERCHDEALLLAEAQGD